MARITANSTFSTPVIPKSETSAIPKSETSVAEAERLSYSERETNGFAWQYIMDYKLLEWVFHPELLEDDGLVAISHKIISEALKFCRLESGNPVPSNVVPNGDGGIVFEWKEGSYFRTIEFLADGSKEDCFFIDSHIKSRQRF